jgi:hypothetical protein
MEEGGCTSRRLVALQHYNLFLLSVIIASRYSGECRSGEGVILLNSAPRRIIVASSRGLEVSGLCFGHPNHVLSCSG